MFKKISIVCLLILFGWFVSSSQISGTRSTDFSLDVARGSVFGISFIHKFGTNDSIASGATEEIWDGSSAYVFPTTALMTSISQTTDQVALRGGEIEVQGLDANWALTVQTVNLDATDTTTVVALGTPLLRCFRMRVQENVVTTSQVRVHNAGETQDYAVIDTGNNQTRMAVYTVPDGKTAFMTSWYATINPATNQDPTAMPIRTWVRDNINGYARQLRHVHGLTSGHIQHFHNPYMKVTQRSDIFMSAAPVGKAADVSSGFDLILVDN